MIEELDVTNNNVNTSVNPEKNYKEDMPSMIKMYGEIITDKNLCN